MKNDDQWFEPGDKVVRVSQNQKMGANTNDGLKHAPFGVVFCVESMRRSLHKYNVVLLVGAPVEYNQLGKRKGFVASNFRKVEEIQLCVRAAEAMKKPKKQEEMA